MDIAAAQKDLRNAYYDGVPGVLISGLVWLLSGLVAFFSKDTLNSLITLGVGGMFIFPLSIVFSKLMGRTGTYEKGNPMGTLAGQSTFPLVVCFPIAYIASLVNIKLFFPAMLLVIGCRYLIFVTIYGLGVYWLFGFVLIASGFVVAFLQPPFYVGGLTGGLIEILFAAIIFMNAKKYLLEESKIS